MIECRLVLKEANWPWIVAELWKCSHPYDLVCELLLQQGRRQVWKSGRTSFNAVGIGCPTGSYSPVLHSLQAGMAFWLLRGCFNCHNEAQINNQMPTSIVSAVCGVFSFLPISNFLSSQFDIPQWWYFSKMSSISFLSRKWEKRWDGNMPIPQYTIIS